MTEQALEGAEGTQVVKSPNRITWLPPKAGSKLARSFRTPLWHRVAERSIVFVALTAIAAIALIFIFIAREAIPMLWESDFAEEVELAICSLLRSGRATTNRSSFGSPWVSPPSSTSFHFSSAL